MPISYCSGSGVLSGLVGKIYKFVIQRCASRVPEARHYNAVLCGTQLYNNDGKKRFFGFHPQDDIAKKAAFTLAEVLITLGVIGVVAAMTLPTLIQANANKVVEARLKKFYSTFNQAIQLAEAEYGDRVYWYIDAQGVELDEEGNPILSTAQIDQWLSKYLYQFIIFKRKVDKQGRVLYYLSDGSAFQCGIQFNPSLRDIYFYPGNPDKCVGDDKDIVGVCVWKFEYLPTSSDPSLKDKGLEPFPNGSADMYTDSERGCYVDSPFKSYCTKVIQANGWTIPKDYPYKVRY